MARGNGASHWITTIERKGELAGGPAVYRTSSSGRVQSSRLVGVVEDGIVVQKCETVTLLVPWIMWMDARVTHSSLRPWPEACLAQGNFQRAQLSLLNTDAITDAFELQSPVDYMEVFKIDLNHIIGMS